MRITENLAEVGRMLKVIALSFVPILLVGAGMGLAVYFIKRQERHIQESINQVIPIAIFILTLAAFVLYYVSRRIDKRKQIIATIKANNESFFQEIHQDMNRLIGKESIDAQPTTRSLE